MKKILGIIFLSLLLNGNSFVGVEEVLKEIKKNKDIVQGYKRIKRKDLNFSAKKFKEVGIKSTWKLEKYEKF